MSLKLRVKAIVETLSEFDDDEEREEENKKRSIVSG